MTYFGYANLTTLYMYGLVAGTKSKYATTAAARLTLLAVFLEVAFMLLFLGTYTHIGGFSFAELVLAAGVTGGLLVAMPPLGLWFFLYALFESKRAPFDHSEAESELVAGHLVEYGGRALLFFYLCEYAHLLACIALVFVLVGGGAGGWLSGCWPY